MKRDGWTTSEKKQSEVVRGRFHMCLAMFNIELVKI